MLSKKLSMKLQEKGVNGPPGSMYCTSYYHNISNHFTISDTEFYGKSEILRGRRVCKACANLHRRDRKLPFDIFEVNGSLK